MAEDYCPELLSTSISNTDTSKLECNVVSKITIEFNERFILFMVKLKSQIDVNALALKDTYMLMPIQEDIRNYIIENQLEFDLVGGKKITENNHPNIFAIMICVIIQDLREYDSFQEILDESQKYRWEIGMQSSNELNDTGYENSYGEQNFRCACNKSCSPENMYLISNLETGMNIAVGCECITKTKFIEPHELTELEKKSKNDPHYIAIKRVRHIKKMNDGLSKKRKHETIESIGENFKYIGGNFGQHKHAAELYFSFENDKKKTKYTIEDFQRDVCGICDQKNIKDNILLANIPDATNKKTKIKAVCKKCIGYLDNIKFKQKGRCDDCGKEHKNKSDNYCNACRLKEECTICDERDFLDGKRRCNICRSYEWCKRCERERVNKKGWLCKPCYDSSPLCDSPDCNTTITDLRYKTCYPCKFKNNNNTKICNFPNCNRRIDPKYKTCWSCKFGNN